MGSHEKASPRARNSLLRNQSGGTAGFFDLLLGRTAELMCGNGKLFGQFAVTEDLDSVDRAANETCGAQSGFIDARSGFEVLEIGNVHDGVLDLEVGVVETALRNTTDKRHLTAFESEADAAARTRLLTFVAFAGGLTVAAAFAAAEPLDAVLGTRTGLESVQIHFLLV